MELCGKQHYVAQNKHYSAAVRAAIARILTHDQWIWLRDESAPCEDDTMTQALRQAISRFARLFGALTGAFSGQETQNHTRAKVLLSAIVHTLTDPSLRSSNRRKSRHSRRMNSTYERSDDQAHEDLALTEDSSLLQHRSRFRTSFMKRKAKDTELLPNPKLAKADTFSDMLPREPASLNSDKRSLPDLAMDTLSTKLASSFYALCVAPGSENCQRRFMKRHIKVTLALLKRGQSPGALAAEWVAGDMSIDLGPLTDSSDSSEFSEDNNSADTEKRQAPLVVSPIGKLMAVSAVMFAVEVRHRIKLSLLDLF